MKKNFDIYEYVHNNKFKLGIKSNQGTTAHKVYNDIRKTALDEVKISGDKFDINENLSMIGKVYSDPYHRSFSNILEGSEIEDNEPDEVDHEVSMAQNQLNSIIKAANELKSKIGSQEKNIPAWIQDHITNAENYITQASDNYHEYDD